uniref:Uncharacterized protein n=1 Tax=Rhizophora mucronata TaxID=61149 RepID=A0A2P2PZB3_RHIMU
MGWTEYSCEAEVTLCLSVFIFSNYCLAIIFTESCMWHLFKAF